MMSFLVHQKYCQHIENTSIFLGFSYNENIVKILGENWKYRQKIRIYYHKILMDICLKSLFLAISNVFVIVSL